MSTATAPTFERPVFTQSRMMDFFSEKSLIGETGHEPYEWPLMTVKELVDNALDACEATNNPPVIEIKVDETSISVKDNGPGLPVETLKSILDFTTRTSSNAKLVSPSRGSQGNALKTLLAASYVLSENDQGFVHVSTNDRGFDIAIATHPLRQEPIITQTETDGFVKNGTFVKVEFPRIDGRQEKRILQIVERYAVLNPHASFSVRSTTYDRQYPATNPAWAKWLTCWATSPLWYSPQDFESLIAAHIAHDGGVLTVREFIKTFNGFSGSIKQTPILDETDLARRKLADFVVDGELDHQRIANLLESLKRHAKEVNPKKLGVIGEAHLRGRFIERGGDADQFRYKCYAGTEDGLPFVIEAAFAYMPERELGETQTGVNWAASISSLTLQLGERWTLDSLLSDCRADCWNEPVFVFLHLATPTPGHINWLEKRKNTANLQGEVAEKVIAAVRSVTKDWKKLRDAEDRSAAKSCRKEQLRKQKKRPEITLKDAILLEILAGIAEVSGDGQYPFNDRNFYYAIRPRVQRRGVTRSLTQKYFDSVVKGWEKQHGIIELRNRDSRGHLIEPHTGMIIPLGTAEVKDYEVPTWLYHTILSVEKKGFGPLFQKIQMAEKYDTAIMSSEGYAVDAAKMLLSRAQEEQQVTILCLHDADPYGKNIARRIQKATGRSKAIKVIDIGLNLDDALAMNLPMEDFERQKNLPKNLPLTPLEERHFIGEFIRYNKKGKPVYRCQRVELNALAANPSAFIAYVEQQLEKHGCKRKLVPPDDVVRAQAIDVRRAELSRVAREEVEAALDVASLVQAVIDEHIDEVHVDDIPDFLNGWKDKLIPQSWNAATQNELQARASKLRLNIQKTARKTINKK